MAKLLDLPGAKELIARKAKLLCVADTWVGPGTKKLLAEWPTGIVAVPKEVGDALPFPASAMEKELAWAPAHPIVDAWRAAGGKDRSVGSNGGGALFGAAGGPFQAIRAWYAP